MFHHARKFNGNISAWKVDKVTDMSEMFNGAYQFNIDISAWNIHRVKSTGRMFLGAQTFSMNLCPWLNYPDFLQSFGRRNMFGGSKCPNKSNPTNSNVCFNC